MKKTLLKAIGVALAITCGPVGAVDSTLHPGTATPAVYQQALAAGAAVISAQGMSIGEAHAGTLQLPSSANSATLSSSGTQIALSTVTASGHSPLRLAAKADRQQGGGYLVPVASIPEPSGGAMLLCGLAVVVYIARRKTQPVVD